MQARACDVKDVTGRILNNLTGVVEGGIDSQVPVILAAADLARRMAALGYEHLVYTDIARDGMQTGVENGAYAKMAAAFGNPVIVSGGIATAADIRALAPIADAVEGVITGRAIYEGTLTVADGVAACDGTFQLSDQLEEEEHPLTIEELEN